eukprot:6481745-Amphidinium_carterae.2
MKSVAFITRSLACLGRSLEELFVWDSVSRDDVPQSFRSKLATRSPLALAMRLRQPCGVLDGRSCSKLTVALPASFTVKYDFREKQTEKNLSSSMVSCGTWAGLSHSDTSSDGHRLPDIKPVHLKDRKNLGREDVVSYGSTCCSYRP